MTDEIPRVGRWSASRSDLLILIAILLVAACLRIPRLDSIPPGVQFDEAANYILAREVAQGKNLPIFVTAYAGREALFYWLAGGWMVLIGESVFAFRLTAALIGLLTVWLVYLLSRELFFDWAAVAARWLALLAAALAAVSFWQVLFSRFGFRGMTLPPVAAAMLWTTWRGLRRNHLGWLALGGALCGLTAYTYLAGLAVPLALLFPWAVLLMGMGRRRWGQAALFASVALIVVAPLALFFLTHPQDFGVRMGQVSVLSPEVHGGDPWGALGRATLKAAGMFTVRGDADVGYNLPGRPVFGPVVGSAFYLGLVVSVWRLFKRQSALSRARWLLLLAWLPVMLLPSVLGAREVPHHLRSIGTVPVAFVLPALGFVTLWRGLWTRWPGRIVDSLPPVALALLLVLGSVSTYRAYFGQWAGSAALFYRTDADLRAAAEYLNAYGEDGMQPFISVDTYHHPSLAALAEDYASLRWLIDGQVLVFPPEGMGLYLFPRALPRQSWMARFFPLDSLIDEIAGPKGTTALQVYRLEAGAMPAIAPSHPLQANLGHKIELLGYDLSPAAAGESVDATLYWRVLAPPEAGDYALFAHLQDAWGFRWSSDDLFDYPSADWLPDQVIVQRRKVAIPVVAPPGDYELVVGFFSQGRNARLPRFDDEGRVAGTTVRLGPVDVDAAAAPPDMASLAIQQPADAAWDGLRLLGFERDRMSVEQGGLLYLGLFWRATEPLPNLEMHLSMVSVEGRETVGLWAGRPVHDTYPTDEWPMDAVVLDRYGLTVPRDASGGDYLLRLDVRDRSTGQLAGEPVSLGRLYVEAVERRMAVPSIEHPLAVDLGDRVQFLGYDLDRTEVSPGETLYLTLYWRALAEMETSYTVFTHLLDGADQIRAQQDNPPMSGSYPTTLWVSGEVVVDEYALTVDADAPPGEHVIEIGLYVAETGQRLPVLSAVGEVIGDRLLLSEVQVIE